MRARGVGVAVCLAVGLVATGCGDRSPVVYVARLPPDAGPDLTPDQSCGCISGACGADFSPDALRANPSSFATFNTGLDAAYASQRLPLILDSLRQIPVDVVCLQEVRRSEDVAALTSGLREVYPYVLDEKTGKAAGNGLLLLSRKRINNGSFTPMNTVGAPQGALRAAIGNVTVLCTQLPGPQATPYPGGSPYKSWSEEHAGATLALESAAPLNGCSVVLGDLRAGPAGPGLSPVEEASYQSLAAEFREPWTDPACTLCAENPLSGSAKDEWTDHILFRGCRGGQRYSRILDGTATVKVGAQTLEARLSSHYGLEARWP